MPVTSRKRLVALSVLVLMVAASGGARGDDPHACVGDPPRQTEDPLSPRCVASWEGDNGGVTWQGVTGDEIRVVLYNDIGISGDMNAPYDPSEDSSIGEGQNLRGTIKALLRYFQDRFETYDRTVRLSASPGFGSDGARRRDAISDYFRFKPFAAVTFYAGMDAYISKMAEFDVMTFGPAWDVGRQTLQEAAPYAWTFLPDRETEADYSAAFICTKLVPHELPARFSPDPLLQTQPRKVGLIYAEDSGRGEYFERNALALMDAMQARCGHGFDEVASFRGGGADRATDIISEFQTSGITTVLCYCVPVPGELSVTTFQTVATSRGYFPEWYWDHGSVMDRPVWQQIYGNRAQRSFGVSYFWRMPAMPDQQWYRAYVQATGDGTKPNVRWGWHVYHALLHLFTAIQETGPDLNPEAVSKALVDVGFRAPDDPWTPTGGHEPATGERHSFVDTAMAWWWDPLGTTPGGAPATGCQRVVAEGRRSYADTWTPGDADLFVPGEPCTEGAYKIDERI